MGAVVSFEQLGESALFATRVEGSVGWAAYVLPGGTLPPSISMADSFGKYQGHYLFAATAPPLAATDPTAFAQQALKYFAKYAGINRGVAWLEGDAFGDFPGHGFSFSTGQWGTSVASNLNVALGRNVNFFLLTKVTLTVEDTGLLLTFRPGSQPYIGFQRGSNLIGISVTAGATQVVRIPVAGPSTGAMVFPATVNTAAAFSSSGVAAGFEYHFGTGSALTTVFYPAFDTAALPATLSCVGTLDPSDRVNTALAAADLEAGHLRTGFTFAGQPQMPSAFRTSSGQPVTLVPLGTPQGATAPPPGAGGLAFASDSDASAGTARTVYLAPAGTYGLAPQGSAAPPQKLLCGLFGSEHLTFDPTAPANDALFFLPSQPAFATGYPYPEASLDHPGSGDVAARLDPSRVTSWATIVSASGTSTYSAQPEGTPLYGASGASDDGTPSVLDAVPPEHPLPQGPANAFPLVPYAGGPSAVRGSAAPAVVTSLESQVIAPERKAIVSAAATETWAARAAHRTAAVTSAPTYTTTPQGFVVQLDGATGTYRNVQLAQSLGPSGAPVPFAFDNPTIGVQDALQTNQLFLVAANGAPFDSDGASFEDKVLVEDWTMEAPVGNGASLTDYRNVMILKFCHGALADRVKNPNRWTDPGTFSLLPGADPSIAFTGLSQWLQSYIASAIALADGGSPFYAYFKQIVTDASWKGVLVLRSDLAADDLPPEIRGIAPGIDFSRFYAHHFGFTVSPVKVTNDPNAGQTITVDGSSSIFGLIDYQNPAYEQNTAAGLDPDTPIKVATSGDFAFTVLQLRSRFENTKLVEFESRVQLTVEKLFGSGVTQALTGGVPLPATGVVLDGSYVDQGGKPSYVFQTGGVTVLRLDSNVLPAIALDRVQFNTLDSAGAGGRVSSRFLVWGALDFAPLNDSDGAVFDVLSFGSAPATPAAGLGTGLAFSNLAIEMSFPATTPNAPAFGVDAANLAWDLAASTPRAESLFKGFGLQLAGFVGEAAGKTPADLGYLPVSTSLPLTDLGDEWFGVVYDVTLGGPGALASAAGFSSTMLLAWSPSSAASDEETSLFVGLSLPGAAPGAKLFSLQGVLKVAVGAITLIRQPVPGGSGDLYCLRLDDIALKVFGVAKLPPDATIQFFLFGDPGSTGSLGWYAAYVADDAKPKAPALETPGPALPAPPSGEAR
ncbi:MAG TPA: hypothetical protein VG318_15240 [Actinomycetota bacterium]|nr:hypothetical protein [Actinomycetota bacterium]